MFNIFNKFNIAYKYFCFFEEMFNKLLLKAVPRNKISYFKSDHKKKILISKLDSIGDFVIFTATLPLYRVFFKDEYIVLLVRSDVYNLVEFCPYVDEVWAINQRRFRRSIKEHLRWYRLLKKANFDIAINAVYSENFSFFDCLIGWTFAPRRIAFQCLKNTTSVRAKSNYYNEYVDDKNSDGMFELDRNRTMIDYLGADTSLEYRQPTLWPTEQDKKTVSDLIVDLGIQKYAVLFPGARDNYRSWDKSRFAELSKHIILEFNVSLVLAGGPNDTTLCAYLDGYLKQFGLPCYDMSGKTSLRELSCLINLAEFCISAETSAAHISAAVCTPCLCIMGGGHFGRFYPYPGNQLTRSVTNRLPCFGCNWLCTRDQVECISGITVSQVLSVLKVFLVETSVMQG